MAKKSLKILTWNLERKKTDSPLGSKAIDHLFSMGPDIMVISETRTDFPRENGYIAYAKHPGMYFAENERKVLIWSKYPLSNIDDEGHVELPPSRFVSAMCASPTGELQIVGVCIPWHMAYVRNQAINKKPWESHIDYLKLFPDLLGKYKTPILIAGDFNQRIPRARYGNKSAAAHLERCFENFNIVTSGIPTGVSRQGIDHIAIGPELIATNVFAWPNEISGQRLSDHDGVGCDLYVHPQQPGP